MASLKVKTGSRREVEKGFVDVQGSCILLVEEVKGKRGRIVFAYCLQPGETVSSEGDDYIVEF